MLAFGWLVGMAVVGASVAASGLALWAASRLGAAPDEAERLEAGREGAPRVVALFDGGALHDATEAARALLDATEGGGDARARFLRHLEPRFGPLAEAVADLEARGVVERRARDGARLEARWCDGLARVEIAEAPPAAAEDEREGDAAARAHLGAIEAELRMLRAAVEASPWPIWHTAPDGAVDWANPAYVERAAPPDAAGPPGWPPPALFEGQSALARPGRGPDPTGGLRPGGAAHRLRAAPSTRAGAQAGGRVEGAPDDPEAWYDCVARPGVEPGGAMHFATPAASAVRAERSLHQFVQTLSKTFAHLPVGLAVFDQKRGLSLFNPALTEMTTLPVDFLSARPTLHAFIDRLREARRMPEPRDWRSWRERILALEAASAEGTYLETWNLSGGQTWRVSGRPHPDGAIALMFEDITAEIALTRRFRSELEVSQAVVDAMREAIAVFAPDGVLTLANEAYARLWGSDPRHSLGDMGVADASRGWMAQAEPSPLWGELRDFVGQMGERTAWTGEARLRDGRRLDCRAVPLAAGATLICFVARDPEGGERLAGGDVDALLVDVVEALVVETEEPSPAADPAPRLIGA